MALSNQTKFWLKVGLSVTFPLWLIPALLLAFAGSVAMMIWCSVAELVDGFTDDDGADE